VCLSVYVPVSVNVSLPMRMCGVRESECVCE